MRDWLFVADHCAAIDRILSAGLEPATFNVGGRAELPNAEIVNRICELVDAKVGSDTARSERFPDCPAARGAHCAELIEHVVDRPGHDRRYAIDATRIENVLGFEPAESLESGLARTVDWYLENEGWWRPILDGSFRQSIEEQYGSAQARDA